MPNACVCRFESFRFVEVDSTLCPVVLVAFFSVGYIGTSFLHPPVSRVNFEDLGSRMRALYLGDVLVSHLTASP